ncbi:MAG TPA: hypothetical protein VN783_15925 [Thermoanaerobaculia bacterium]|nr:hypothetical protein [Thermoanaerobaculia bacterium]
MKRIGFGIALLLTLVAMPTFAQANPVWTAVASTGVIDEAALGFFAFGTTNLGYKNNALQPIVARYNVVNIAGFVNPAWTTLELGYLDTSANTQVAASLWEVNPCTGTRVLKCTVVSVDNNASTCATCQFAGIDFVNFLYYVELTIARNANVNVQANTLRIW